MATTNGAFYKQPSKVYAAGVQVALSREVDTLNIGAALTGLDDKRNVLYLHDGIELVDWYIWQKLIDTDATATTDLSLEVTDGTTTKVLVDDFTVSNAGAEDMKRAGSAAGGAIGEILDNGGAGLWTVEVNAPAAAATAGTVGELVVMVAFQPLKS